jgi:chlorobactene glucosyltransferase
VEFILSCAWLAVVALLIMRAAMQRSVFGAAAPVSAPAESGAPHVLVVIPARNEEANIARCLKSLLAQNYPKPRFEICVVDDHSSDNTIAFANCVIEGETRARVLAAPPLPSGWTGKSHACWIGAENAAMETEWLCFIDADVQASPELLSTAIGRVQKENLDLLSLSPRQHLMTFAERLVMPCGLYCLAFSQDLRTKQDAQNEGVVVCGQFLLVRRSVYCAARGHAAVAAEICDDTALALRLKAQGARVRLEDGSAVLSVRMYTGWRTLWLGLTKNLVDMLGGPLRAGAAAFLAPFLAWTAIALPVYDAYRCSLGEASACLGFAPALIGSLAVFGLHLAGARFFVIPLWYGLAFPLGYTAGAALALDSLRRRLQRRIVWKGRVYR